MSQQISFLICLLQHVLKSHEQAIHTYRTGRHACGDGEGKEAENCHGRCGGKVMELLWMVSALDGECVDGEGKEACHGRCGGKLMCFQNMPEQTNESTNIFPHLFAPTCPEIT